MGTVLPQGPGNSTVAKVVPVHVRVVGALAQPSRFLFGKEMKGLGQSSK